MAQLMCSIALERPALEKYITACESAEQRARNALRLAGQNLLRFFRDARDTVCIDCTQLESSGEDLLALCSIFSVVRALAGHNKIYVFLGRHLQALALEISDFPHASTHIRACDDLRAGMASAGIEESARLILVQVPRSYGSTQADISANTVIVDTRYGDILTGDLSDGDSITITSARSFAVGSRSLILPMFLDNILWDPVVVRIARFGRQGTNSLIEPRRQHALIVSDASPGEADALAESYLLSLDSKTEPVVLSEGGWASLALDLLRGRSRGVKIIDATRTGSLSAAVFSELSSLGLCHLSRVPAQSAASETEYLIRPEVMRRWRGEAEAAIWGLFDPSSTVRSTK
jgi:hypothetical protein